MSYDFNTLGALLGGLIGTGDSVGMSISDRMKLIPYEAIIGLVSTVVAVIWYVI